MNKGNRTSTFEVWTCLFRAVKIIILNKNKRVLAKYKLSHRMGRIGNVILLSPTRETVL